MLRISCDKTWQARFARVPLLAAFKVLLFGDGG